MTHSLTPHEQQQVDTACKDYHTQQRMYGTTRSFWSLEEDFKRGVDFALQHLFAGRMERFAEWVRTRDGNQKMALNDHDWYYDADHDGDLPIPDEELVRQFIQETKQKEDGILKQNTQP